MDPVIIDGDEQSKVDPSLPDAGIPPAVGVHNVCVFASQAVPELADKYGWTYNHHIDMASWKGRLYVGWNSCEKDEDIWPARELYSSSTDGITWTEPAEMFPQGVSTCLRMYFFLAPNKRMLIIAGLRASTEKTDEDLKGGLVVRELRADHTLGEVFTLQSPAGVGKKPPSYETSRDAGFLEACKQLLSDTVYLEQQDRGRLLRERAMKWHRAESWPGGKVPGDNEKWVAGKAFSFYRRKDGVLVGLSKMGWVTTSTDNGKTWAQPVVPESLITGKAKIWGQQTSDGKFALVFNPSTGLRFPLIVVTGEDGIHFRNMRLVHGELPRQRYPGKDRSIGPQYTRGISTWANDGSRDDRAMWLVYSSGKEDIWVSRVPLPIKPDATTWDEPWNAYYPKWASIRVIGETIELTDRDPYDYAQITQLFPASTAVVASFDIEPGQADQGTLEVDLMGGFGSPRAVRLALTRTGLIVAGGVEIGRYEPEKLLTFQLAADTVVGRYSLTIDGQMAVDAADFSQPVDSLSRICFRTGEHRGIGGKNPVIPDTDRPLPPSVWRVSRVKLMPV